MGCAQSTSGREAKARNDAIETQLKYDSQKAQMAKDDIKILLVGTPESGKSTLLKQVKIIYHGGYDDSEREAYKEIIYSNTIESMRSILEAMPALRLALTPQYDAHRATILALPSKIEASALPRDVAAAIRSLWFDPNVQEAVRRSREFQLNDSAVYFFNAIDRMALANYRPTDQDILCSWVKAGGVMETTLKTGELTYRLYNAGCHWSPKKQPKWIHYFEDITALLFFVNLTVYDHLLYDDENSLSLDESVARGRLGESETLFDLICNSRWFIKTAIILFMNKVDVFSEKLVHSPLKDYCFEYTGGSNFEAACDFLLHRFVCLNRSPSTKAIYAHYTCATDPEQMKVGMKYIFGAIQDNQLQQHLRECGPL